MENSSKFEEGLLKLCAYIGLEQRVMFATRYNTILDVVLVLLLFSMS